MEELMNEYREKNSPFSKNTQSLGLSMSEKENEEENFKKEFEIKFNKIRDKLFSDNELFRVDKKTDFVKQVIEKGRKNAENISRIVTFLSNISEVLPNMYDNIPVISLLQAFMIKEIASGYGFVQEFLNNINLTLIKKIENELVEEKYIDNNSNFNFNNNYNKSKKNYVNNKKNNELEIRTEILEEDIGY